MKTGDFEPGPGCPGCPGCFELLGELTQCPDYLLDRPDRSDVIR